MVIAPPALLDVLGRAGAPFEKSFQRYVSVFEPPGPGAGLLLALPGHAGTGLFEFTGAVAFGFHGPGFAPPLAAPSFQLMAAGAGDCQFPHGAGGVMDDPAGWLLTAFAAGVTRSPPGCCDQTACSTFRLPVPLISPYAHCAPFGFCPGAETAPRPGVTTGNKPPGPVAIAICAAIRLASFIAPGVPVIAPGVPANSWKPACWIGDSCVAKAFPA